MRILPLLHSGDSSFARALAPLPLAAPSAATR